MFKMPAMTVSQLEARRRARADFCEQVWLVVHLSRMILVAVALLSLAGLVAYAAVSHAEWLPGHLARDSIRELLILIGGPSG